MLFCTPKLTVRQVLSRPIISCEIQFVLKQIKMRANFKALLCYFCDLSVEQGEIYHLQESLCLPRASSKHSDVPIYVVSLGIILSS